MMTQLPASSGSSNALCQEDYMSKQLSCGSVLADSGRISGGALHAAIRLENDGDIGADATISAHCVSRADDASSTGQQLSVSFNVQTSRC
jgi:hypothetical protein